jgi:chemotaxis response regulator CheB
VSGGNFSFISAAKIYGSDVVGVVLSGGDTTELKDPSG